MMGLSLKTVTLKVKVLLGLSLVNYIYILCCYRSYNLSNLKLLQVQSKLKMTKIQILNLSQFKN